MIRNLDVEGRISIPKEMREKLDMKTKDSIRIELVDDMIILTSEKKAKTIFTKNDKKVKEHIEKKRT